MTDQPKKQVSPMAAAVELTALNEYFRNRNLMLADALERKQQELDAMQTEVDRLTKINGQLQDAAAKSTAKGKIKDSSDAT
ncbi:hypothetical protein ACFPOD_04840 [Nitratireductor kimnyeongensis]|uniref:Uncharacterized protein n=1 Tax=Nitratireductor kimnyeongensis TaxID=430679 RepID=A0ABW0T6J7_9HYPH|nr:hypothetical protein [Nitratireductor kimnyeongensis]QZZ34589.1 hypothetical protein KW403_12355 [Nitratireductor kimnyeongensis]